MKITSWTFLIPIILVVIIGGYSVFQVRNNLENVIWKLKSSLLEERFKTADITECQVYSFNTEGRLLPDTVKKYIPQNACILRLHNDICLGCYAENLSRLQLDLDTLKNVSLFVLGSYNFVSQLKKEMFAVNLQQVQFINLSSYRIFPADNLDRPYLFTINASGLIQNLYFFQKEDFLSTSKYLEGIERLNNIVNNLE